MSVIIRLQNLPWSANALDIRHYFHGLSIPEGGVHIVGGELGDAFIAFSTDEDARQAFGRNNGKIKEVQISLMLSSRTEMQRVIEAARAQSYAAFMQPSAATVPQHVPTSSTPTGPQPSSITPQSAASLAAAAAAATAASSTPVITSIPATVQPLPSAVPQVVAPAPVPDIKDSKRSSKDKNDRRERRRSRSKSRDRKDKSRDKDRKSRYRDRSRSRSRERKSRSRRDRSRSRGRSRSRERDRRSSKDYRKRSSPNDDRTPSGNQPFIKDRKNIPDVWANQSKPLEVIPSGTQAQPLMQAGLAAAALNQAQRVLSNLATEQLNGFQSNNNFKNGSRDNMRSSRDSWPPSSANDFGSSRTERIREGFQDQQQPFQGRFSKSNFVPCRIPEKDCCIAVEPFYGGYSDLRRFFRGLFISSNGIKFINDHNGRRTGIVYVQFNSRQHKDEALSLNGEDLNGYNISITHVEDESFEEAVDRFDPRTHGSRSDAVPLHESLYKLNRKTAPKAYNSPQQFSPVEIKEFSCLKVDDLPNYTKEQDILHMFSLHPLVALILTPKPKGGHIAYAKFSNQEEAQKAYEEKSHHVVGGKQVIVKPCKDEEFEDINRQHDVDVNPKVSKASDNQPSKEIDTDCISMSNLPVKTTDKDISDFFSDIGVMPTKIHLMRNSMGFTGQAYCEFSSIEDAKSALRKNETVLGESTVTVAGIKREGMMDILNNTLSVSEPIDPTPSNAEQRAPSAGFGDSRGFEGTHFSGMAPRMRPPFFPRGHFDGTPRGMIPRFGSRGLRQMAPRFQHQQQAPMGDNGEDAPKGCTVYMKNVPYKAATEEILKFFEGYNHTQNVSRRYNPNNTPSDEAKIIFFSPEEASKAVAELNKKKIWERQIFLRQE